MNNKHRSSDGGGGTVTAAEKTTADNAKPNPGGNGSGIGGVVDTSRADKAVWLMKCPPVVSRFLSPSSFSSSSSSSTSSSSSSVEAPPPHDPSRPIAKVVLSIDPLLSNEDDASPEFSMELAGIQSGNLPKCYSLHMSKDFIPMSVFSESSQGRISVEGKILNKFDMKLHNQDIESYGKLCRERASKSMNEKKNKQIQIIENDRGTYLRPALGLFVEKKKVIAKQEVKKERRDRGDVEHMLFNMFEGQQNWTLKQLIKETNQPENFIKNIIKDLCIYNNKGSNQGTYELKPEYRRQ